MHRANVGVAVSSDGVGLVETLGSQLVSMALGVRRLSESSVEQLEVHVAIADGEEAELHVHVDTRALTHKVCLYSMRTFKLTMVATISRRMSSTVVTSV